MKREEEILRPLSFLFYLSLGRMNLRKGRRKETLLTPPTSLAFRDLMKEPYVAEIIELILRVFMKRRARVVKIEPE